MLSEFDYLESPPPLLRVTMMGEFTVIRGNTLIAPHEWRRPAVRRLFQYFVLNQGKSLLRESILEDLWPESSPDAARASFKTIYSWMRKAIEPDLRPKSPSRYVRVEQESYQFNPSQSRALLQCDVFEFEGVIMAVLAAADDHDVRPLPAEFTSALDSWRPLLPELLHEAWTVAPRERLESLYVRGCLYAAGAMLDSARPGDAARWAQRAITVAPWSEEAWQDLMRAQARMNHRDWALATYTAAVAALARELDAPPSAMLDWLAKRLRDGENI